jgi:hypothetical protein
MAMGLNGISPREAATTFVVDVECVDSRYIALEKREAMGDALQSLLCCSWRIAYACLQRKSCTLHETPVSNLVQTLFIVRLD